MMSNIIAEMFLVSIHNKFRNSALERNSDMKQKSLGVNALLNGIKQCCSIIFPLITFPYISRVLGSDGYGKYSFSNSVTNYFVLLAALGIYTYAIREGAKIRDDQKSINQFCSQIFSINVCSSVISLLLLFAMVFFLPKFSGYKVYIFIQSTAIVMAAVGPDWVNGIYEDYFFITIRYIAVQCVCLFAMFIFVRNPEDIIPYCVISVLATNGGNLINVFYIRKYVKIRFIFNMNLKKHLVPLLILFANSIAITIYVNSDITMLGFFESDGQVGIYSFASKIYNLLKQLINAVIVVSVPRIAYVVNNKPTEYKTFINKIFAALNILLIPVIVGMFCMSDSMILLAGGEQYISGNISLKILSVATLFAIYASLFTNCVLIVNRQEKFCLKATIISAIVNVGLNFVMIPWLGMIGSAITTVIAEFVNCVMQIHFSKPFFDWRKLDIKPVISCVCGSNMIGVVCMICNRSFDSSLLKMISTVLISAVVYMCTLIVMKNPYAQEFVWIIVGKTKNLIIKYKN